MHRFIFDNKKKHHVNRMCRTLSVNEKGYYKWLRNGDKPKKWQNLLVDIHKILDEVPDNDNYGAKRMLMALTQEGIFTSLSSVRTAMRNGNLLKRDFTAKAPNEKWLTDITQVSCKDGKLYIAPVFDCFGGEIISLAMDTNMKKELCISALEAAFELRNPKSGVIVHSDTGSQHTSEAYRLALGKHHAIQSMSNVGKCYDATLKKEKDFNSESGRSSSCNLQRKISSCADRCLGN